MNVNVNKMISRPNAHKKLIHATIYAKWSKLTWHDDMSQYTSTITPNKPKSPQKLTLKPVKSLWGPHKVQCGRWTDAGSLLSRSTLKRVPPREVTSYQIPMEPGLSGFSLALFQQVISFTTIQSLCWAPVCWGEPGGGSQGLSKWEGS